MSSESGAIQRLNKPQSYVSKYERGERRLDFVEFLELAAILDIDVMRFVAMFREQKNWLKSSADSAT